MGQQFCQNRQNMDILLHLLDINWDVTFILTSIYMVEWDIKMEKQSTK